MMSRGGAGRARSGRRWLGRAGAGAARRAEQGARAVRAAGCRGLRKVWSVELAKMRGLAGKELAASGAMLGRGRAGRARRRAARLGAAACGHGAGRGRRHGLEASPPSPPLGEWSRVIGEWSRDQAHLGHSSRLIFLVAANTEISRAATEVVS